MKKVILLAGFIVFSVSIFAQSQFFKIDRIKVNNIPFKNESHNPWDLMSNPDIRIVILDSLNNIVYETNTFQDISQGMFPIKVEVKNSPVLKTSGITYKIQMLDEDVTKFELIDETDFFTFSVIAFESTFSINTKRYNIIELEIVEYQYME